MAEEMHSLLTLAISLVNIVVGASLVGFMYGVAAKTKGKSMGKTYKVLFSATAIYALVQMMRAASAFGIFGDFPWLPAISIADLLFALTMLYAVLTINESIKAYEFLAQRKEKEKTRDVE